MTASGAAHCRWCGGPVTAGLDLGRQPPADLFPPTGQDVPDARRCPLRMGTCARCGLAQLLEDPGDTEEPRGVEPQALLDQAAQAVAALTAVGLVRPGVTAAEFDSPHGGSWRPLLTAAGCTDVTGAGEPAGLVVDVFGLMHDADQHAALEQRVGTLAPGGTLLLQFHALAAILAQRQWNALRHGHMAYYSTRALTTMLAELGLTARAAWTFELYGGTVLLAATRTDEPSVAGDGAATLATLLAADDAAGLTALGALAPLAAAADADARELRDWLAEHARARRRVVGYGAASRAVPLLVHADIDRTLLPAVADASEAKRGRCLPVGGIPIVAADELPARGDDVVLLFVPDLLAEVRARYPAIEARGGRWAVSEPRPRLVPVAGPS